MQGEGDYCYYWYYIGRENEEQKNKKENENLQYSQWFYYVHWWSDRKWYYLCGNASDMDNCNVMNVFIGVTSTQTMYSQQCQWVLTSFFGPSSLVHVYIKGETCMTYGLKAQFSGINGTIMGTSQI